MDGINIQSNRSVATSQNRESKSKQQVALTHRIDENNGTSQRSDKLELSDKKKGEIVPVTSEGDFLGYRQLSIKSDGEKDTLHGLQYEHGEDVKQVGQFRFGYQAGITMAAARHRTKFERFLRVHVGSDFGGKVFFGKEYYNEKIRPFYSQPRMTLPVGVYAAAGPTVNLTTDYRGISTGLGVYGAVGVDIYGFNLEVRQDLASNYSSLGMRGGVQVRF